MSWHIGLWQHCWMDFQAGFFGLVAQVGSFPHSRMTCMCVHSIQVAACACDDTSKRGMAKRMCMQCTALVVLQDQPMHTSEHEVQ